MVVVSHSRAHPAVTACSLTVQEGRACPGSWEIAVQCDYFAIALRVHFVRDQADPLSLVDSDEPRQN